LAQILSVYPPDEKNDNKKKLSFAIKMRWGDQTDNLKNKRVKNFYFVEMQNLDSFL
jgi:hypothetical protein